MLFRIYECFWLLALAALAASAQTPRKFDFGAQRVAAGYTRVAAADVYDAAKGYGFEPNQRIECLDRAGRDALRAGFCTAAGPFYFSVKAPEGNYRVTVTFGDREAATRTTVKAELRRLMVENAATRAGEFRAVSFVVNVRTPQIAGTDAEVSLKERERTMEWWAWDEKLTLEFGGARPVVSAVEIEKIEVPTVYLLGDSTVSDQPREPYASWGQMLTRFFGPRVAVANHAQSGESLRSSLAARRLEKVLSLIKPGDYLLIQYGHNDEKEKGEGVGPFTTYKARLRTFVAETRKKGGVPVLITPVHRRTFDASGRIANSHGDYPEAVRQVAREENAALIDLTALSGDFYEALGRERSAVAFKEGDGSHHNNYGAYELAKMIAAEIKARKLPLAKYLDQNLPAYDPRLPAPFESFAVPASPLATDDKPFGN